MLGHLVDFEDSVVADVFAGSGSLAFEALSRGATHAYAVEEARGALRTLAANAKALGLEGAITVVPTDAARAAARIVKPLRVAFFDPPYEDVPTESFTRTLDAFCTQAAWEETALIVVEHRAGDEVRAPAGTVLETERTWGDTGVRIFTRGG